MTANSPPAAPRSALKLPERLRHRAAGRQPALYLRQCRNDRDASGQYRRTLVEPGRVTSGLTAPPQAEQLLFNTDYGDLGANYKIWSGNIRATLPF
jgi:hypothetical protein